MDISVRDDYKDFLIREGVKCVEVNGVQQSFGSLRPGGTYTLGPPIQQQQGNGKKCFRYRSFVVDEISNCCLVFFVRNDWVE